nr:MAG: putative dUTPase [unidentified adenovirus]
MASVQYMRMSPAAFDPVVPFVGYPGYELRCVEDYDIDPGCNEVLKTDIIVKIPFGYYGRIMPRIGPANWLIIHKTTVHAGEPMYLHINVSNPLDCKIQVKKGDVIAMLVLQKLDLTTLLERHSVNEMTDIGSHLTVDVCKMEPEAFVPYSIDGGCILRSLCVYVIPPGGRQVISTGVSFRFPEGFYGKLEPVDAMSWNWGMRIEGDIIPSHSRREVRFILVNGGSVPFSINPGDKVAVLRVLEERDLNLVIKSAEDLGVISEVGQEENPEPVASTSGHAMKTRRSKKKLQLAPEYVPMKRKQEVLISSGVVLKAMLVFERTVPDKHIIGRVLKVIEDFIKDQCERLRQCDCGLSWCRECKDYYRRYYSNCLKEISDRSLTFTVTLSGECVHEMRDGPRMAKEMEELLISMTEHLSLKFFVKVIYTRGDFRFL